MRECIFPTAQNSSFIKHAERLRIAALRVDLGKALAADAPPNVKPFTARQCYGESLRVLKAEFNLDWGQNPAADLHIGGPVMPFRIAAAFRVVNIVDWRSRTIFTIDSLRNFTQSEDPEKRRRALMALACMGECDWYSATRDVRAAFLYGEIVTRSRVP